MPRAIMYAWRVTRRECPCVYGSRASSVDESCSSAITRLSGSTSWQSPSSQVALASRRSVRKRRSQPQSMRSAKTMSRPPGRRTHQAEPAAAISIERPTVTASERAHEDTSPAPRRPPTSSAGSTVTEAVATSPWGR